MVFLHLSIQYPLETVTNNKHICQPTYIEQIPEQIFPVLSPTTWTLQN